MGAGAEQPGQRSKRDTAALNREAWELFSAGHYDESADLLRRALDASPGSAEINVNLGAVYHRMGRLAEAQSALERAVALDPGSAAAHDNLGVVLRAMGRCAEAMPYHRRALSLDPEFSLAYANYGLALWQLDETASAVDAYHSALRLDPDNVTAHCGLADSFRKEDDLKSAEDAYRRALAIDAGHLASTSGLADVLSRAGRHDEAVRLLRQAVRRIPDNAMLHLQLAGALSGATRDHEALRIYRRLERAGVRGAAIWFGEAASLSNLGCYPSALRLYRKALAREPQSPLRSSYYFALHASALKSPTATLKDLRQWERHHGAPPGLQRRRHDREPDPERRLRVAYISPDFRQHVVRQFFEPVLLVHDSERFEFYCYSEAARDDPATGEIRAVADRWYSTYRVPDEEVAKQIDRDRIDILVDLAGHTANHRLGVLTYRPAPIQATYLGYFGSTGLSSIDYWITDEVLHPPDTLEPSSEAIHRLPRCGFCYGSPGRVRIERPTRPGHGRPVVFGCFNNVAKVNLRVIDAWAEILRQCGDARLALKDRRFAFGDVRRTWRQRFERRGVPSNRIELHAGSPHNEYLRAYNAIDIALDPFPRTGGTTTCDALWMGVPVVTLAGERYVERLTATKLNAVGVDELITADMEEYVQKAVDLAADPLRLKSYHDTLRERMRRSQLCDAVGLARALEDCYRLFWQRYLNAL